LARIFACMHAGTRIPRTRTAITAIALLHFVSCQFMFSHCSSSPAFVRVARVAFVILSFCLLFRFSLRSFAPHEKAPGLIVHLQSNHSSQYCFALALAVDCLCLS